MEIQVLAEFQLNITMIGEDIANKIKNLTSLTKMLSK